MVAARAAVAVGALLGAVGGVQGSLVDCGGELLAATWSGADSTCANANGEDAHLWPLSYGASDCHGWRAVAVSDGREHDNSANNIRCSEDGTKMLYDQYAGNLDCQGTKVEKEFVFGECHQGIPPTLHDTALDLSCCTDPTGAACAALGSVPGVVSAATTDESIWKNGAECSTVTTAAPTTEAPTTEAPTTEAPESISAGRPRGQAGWALSVLMAAILSTLH